MKLLSVNCILKVPIRRGNVASVFLQNYHFFAFNESVEELKIFLKDNIRNADDFYIIDLGDWENATTPAIECDKVTKHIKFFDNIT